MNQICAWEDEPENNINQLDEWRYNLNAQITVQEQQLKTCYLAIQLKQPVRFLRFFIIYILNYVSSWTMEILVNIF